MSDVNTGPDGTENEQDGVTDTGIANKPNDAPGAQADGNNGDSGNDTFPREYVEELRRESAEYRTKAKDADAKADDLAKRLHRELVKATGRLENPDDLAFDAEHLADDGDKLGAALDVLLADRPYLAKRVVAGDAGQGQRGGADAVPSFVDLLRGG